MNSIQLLDYLPRLYVALAGSIYRRQLLTAPQGAIRYVRQLIDDLLFLEGSGLKSVRDQYTVRICDAVSAPRRGLLYIIYEYDPSPMRCYGDGPPSLAAAAAATGNIGLLQNLLHSNGYNFDAEHNFFPSVLSAAVASGQKVSVAFVLGYLRKGLVPRSNAARNIAEGLNVAVRTFNGGIGHLILDCLFEDPELCPRGYMSAIIEDSLFYGSLALLTRCLNYRKLHGIRFVRNEHTNATPIENEELRTLFGYTSTFTFLDVLKLALFHPNGLDRHLPLDLAIRCGRFDIALVLLNNGADINALDYRGDCALQMALDRCQGPGVRFLIEYGANRQGLTRRMREERKARERTEHPELDIALKVLLGDVRFQRLIN